MEYSLGRLQEIAQGDEAFVRDMLISFVENVSADVEKIQLLIPLENWKAIAGIAHKLVARFAYLSANSLLSLSDDIEESVLVKGDLSEIADKSHKLCNETISLINILKKDFEFLCNLKIN